MAVEAPISRFKKNNIKIYMVACLLGAAWFGYDGYVSKDFQKEHTDADGKMDSTLYANKKGAPIALAGAIVLAFYFLAIKDRKVVADESELKLPAEDAIPYAKIESLDKTHFAQKGYFIINYKDWKDRPTSKKLSDRNWDNLAAVVDHLTVKLQG